MHLAGSARTEVQTSGPCHCQLIARAPVLAGDMHVNRPAGMQHPMRSASTVNVRQAIAHSPSLDSVHLHGPPLPRYLLPVCEGGACQDQQKNSSAQDGANHLPHNNTSLLLACYIIQSCGSYVPQPKSHAPNARNMLCIDTPSLSSSDSTSQGLNCTSPVEH